MLGLGLEPAPVVAVPVRAVDGERTGAARLDLQVDALMGLLREFLVSERDEILHNDIRLVAIGDRFPTLRRTNMAPAPATLPAATQVPSAPSGLSPQP